MTDKKIRVLIAKPGLDGHDRGAKIIARALRDAGMEVIYTGLHQTPEQIAETVIQEDADAVGLSILSGAHMTLVPRVVQLLREQGVPGTFFVLGESIERHRHALAVIRDCGHVIGLHGDRHRPFSSAEHAAKELTRCAGRISEYLSGTPWFRPPYGMGDWPVPGFAGPVGWHAQGQDWNIIYRHGQTVHACVDAIMQRLIERDGGIVLLHDFASATEFVPAGLTERALAIFVAQAEGRWEDVRREFDENMRDKLDAARLAAGWAHTIAMIGNLERIGDPFAFQADDYTLVNVPLHFEAAEATGRVTFDLAAKVAGLFIRPAAAP